MNPTQFAWTGATERIDNTPYLPTDRKGYDMSIRADDGIAVPDDNITLGIISQTQDFVFVFSDLAVPIEEGNWLFTVREVDAQGRVSAWATDVPFSIVVAVPKSPTLLAVS